MNLQNTLKFMTYQSSFVVITFPVSLQGNAFKSRSHGGDYPSCVVLDVLLNVFPNKII